MPAIEDNKSVSCFWALYIFSLLTVLIIICLLIYSFYCAFSHNSYATWPISCLEAILTFTFWALFDPFMESYMSIFKCEYGMLKGDNEIICYEGIHILLVILSLLFIIFLFLISIVLSLFFNEALANSEDAFAKKEDIADFLFLLYRLIVVIYCTLVTNVNDLLF